MRTLVVTNATILALLVATCPAPAGDVVSLPSSPTKGQHAGFISKGRKLSLSEAAGYEAKAANSKSVRLHDAGGAEADTTTMVLATIGALVVVGAILVAANKKDENQ